MRLERLHLCYLLLVPVYFISIQMNTTLEFVTRLSTTVLSLGIATVWIWMILRDKDDDQVTSTEKAKRKYKIT